MQAASVGGYGALLQQFGGGGYYPQPPINSNGSYTDNDPQPPAFSNSCGPGESCCINSDHYKYNASEAAICAANRTGARSSVGAC